ncbi:TniB family NTP-binding protein [Glacieibacterium frigidum]|nr:TniB family NTP-binding protein [Glacieibacterium frigidum]
MQEPIISPADASPAAPLTLASHAGSVRLGAATAVPAAEAGGEDLAEPPTATERDEAFGRLQERMTKLELTIISHPTHDAALDALEECLARARMRSNGRRLKAKARLIYGPSGAGKTTLLEAFLDRHPDVEMEDGDIRRVVPVEMPEQTTKRALVDAVLTAMGYKANNQDTANQIIEQIVDKVQRLGVEMILIDEGHHVVAGSSLEAISEFLKSLLNRVKCQIVILGLPELRELNDYAQFDRRLMPDVVLQPYDWTSVGGRLQWLALLSKFETLLDLPEKSRLASEDSAMAIYVATGGVVGIVSKYLSRALELVTARGLQRVDKALLAEIFAAWHPVDCTPTRIDFTAKLVVPRGETNETLLKKLLSVPIDPETNPFAASAAACEVIWARRLSAGGDVVKAKQRTIGGGRRRVLGKGPPPVRAFGR